MIGKEKHGLSKICDYCYNCVDICCYDRNKKTFSIKFLDGTITVYYCNNTCFEKCKKRRMNNNIIFDIIDF